MNKLDLLLDEVFYNSFTDFGKATSTLPSNSVLKQIDETTQVLDIDLPGFDKSDIEVKVVKNKLFVKAVKLEGDNNTKVLWGSTKNNQKEYKFTIQEDINKDNITCKYQNGILSITLPFKEQYSNKIEVK